MRKLRVSVTGLGDDSGRRLLQVQLQVLGNGALLAVGTCHLTASRESASLHQRELSVVVGSLDSLLPSTDGALLLGDLNLHESEPGVVSQQNLWHDAWVAAGALQHLAGTWCPEEYSRDSADVCRWRFDRVLYSSRDTVDGWRKEGRRASVQLVPDSFAVDFQACVCTDHALP